MEVSMKIILTVYTIQEITSIANSNYQDLLDTDIWQIPDSDTAFISTGNLKNNKKKITLIIIVIGAVVAGKITIAEMVPDVIQIIPSTIHPSLVNHRNVSGRV